MSTITTRSGKGSPLTNNEVDTNFTNLNTDKLESADLAGYATLSGATFTGEVEATGFNGDLTGAILFKGQAGEALTKGDPVYISGISGNKTVVSKADANDANKMPCFGIVDATVSANADCSVVTFGTLQGLDTSSFSEGDELFVSDTGTLTTTAPTGESSQIQKIGKVTRSHASAGSIKVMGAGRTNAVPNLNDGQFFLGNGSNQAVSTDFTTSVLGEISAGTGIGISGSGVISNSAPDQTVSLTGAGTTTVSGTYPNFTITGAGTTYTAGTGITLTGTEFSLTDTNDKLNLTGGTITSGGNIGLKVNHNDFQEGVISYRNHANNSASFVLENASGRQGTLFAQSDNFPYWRDGTTTNSHKIWTAGNDGSGSGLDADTVDGIQASGFLKTDGSNTGTFIDLYRDVDSGFGAYIDFREGSAQDIRLGVNVFDSQLPQAGTALVLDRVGSGGGDGHLVVHGEIFAGHGGTPANGNKVWHAGNDGSGSGLDADLLDGDHKSALYRKVSTANGTAGSGWITVAQCTSSRYHGEVFVTDGESGDHSFIRIDWMRSYADTAFTVLNCGGHQNRITGVRVLNQTSDTTYGTKKLQVYVTTSSNYFVRIHSTGEVSHYSDFTAVTPVVQNSITGYATQGAVLEDLDDNTLATQQGIQTGGGCRIQWVNGGNDNAAAFFQNTWDDSQIGFGGRAGVNRIDSTVGSSGAGSHLRITAGLSGELARFTTSRRLGIGNSSPSYYVDTTFPNTNSTQQHWRFTGYYGGSQCRSYYGMFFIGSSSSTGHGLGYSSSYIYPAEADNASFVNDNAMDLGYAGSRWDDVYATNGTIQTSDEREKQDIEALSDAEQRVAVAAKGLLRKFRWKDAVEEKGDNARTHFGIIAQDLQAAFEAEGLDHRKYAMFIKSEWWIGDKTHPAIDEVLDDEGNVIVEGSPEHIETDHHYDNEEDAPSDATYYYRLGIRYSELLAFIIASI